MNNVDWTNWMECCLKWIKWIERIDWNEMLFEMNKMNRMNWMNKWIDLVCDIIERIEWIISNILNEWMNERIDWTN